MGEQSFDVRALGLFHSLSDIREVVIAEQHGTPVRVRDVADVSVGHAPRLGIVGKDLDPDIVQGTVLMRYGGDSLKTLDNVHEKVDQIANYHILPPGMHIETYYDRANLVELTTHTVIENLLVGMVLVALVLWLFLGHGRAALITALNIPLALMIAFIGMVGTGTPANLISLGAVDFGIVVDSTVIMMENIFRHLSVPGKRNKIERILLAASEVGPPMFSSTLVIAVAFIPLFTLTGVAGVIFSPMAHTYAFAIGGAIVLALTLTPVLAERGSRSARPCGSGETGRFSAWMPRARARQLADAHAEEVLRAAVRLLAAPQARRGDDRRGRRHWQPGRRQLAGARVHAQAGRGELLDPRHAADVDSARAVVEVRRPHARRHPRLPGRRALRPRSTARTPRSPRSSRSSGAPTTAPTSRASTTSSCSRRSSPQGMAARA